MSWLGWVAFALAAAGGAVARHLLDAAVRNRHGAHAPWGILAINASGALLLGLVTGLALEHDLSGTARLVLGTGFAGAFTTFSTFAVEAVGLAERGHGRRAGHYVLATLVMGAVAASAGVGLAHAWGGVA